LRAGISADKRIDVKFLAELVHELHAVAVVEPGILLTGIEAERNGAEQRPGRILADVVVRGRMAHLDGAVLHGIEGLQRRDDLASGERLNLKLVVGGLGHVLGEGFASAIERVERLRPACGEPPSDLRHRLRNRGRGERRGCGSGGANFEKFAAFHGHVPPRQRSWARCGPGRGDEFSTAIHAICR